MRFEIMKSIPITLEIADAVMQVPTAQLGPLLFFVEEHHICLPLGTATLRDWWEALWQEAVRLYGVDKVPQEINYAAFKYAIENNTIGVRLRPWSTVGCIPMELISEMDRKMRANISKGGWRKEKASELFQKLMNEMWELVDAAIDGENVLSEAADVCNFAMMLADKVKPFMLPTSEGDVLQQHVKEVARSSVEHMDELFEGGEDAS